MAGGVGLVYLAYNVSYYLPFRRMDAWTAVPDPADSVPRSAARRRRAEAASSQSCCSGSYRPRSVITATLTGPALPDTASTSVWWDRLSRAEFSAGGYPALAWFGILVAVSAVLATRASRRGRMTRSQLEVAAIGLAGWVVVARAGPDLLAGGLLSGDAALVLLVGAVPAVVYLCRRTPIPECSWPPSCSRRSSFRRSISTTSWAVVLATASVGAADVRRRAPPTGAPPSNDPGAPSWCRAARSEPVELASGERWPQALGGWRSLLNARTVNVQAGRSKNISALARSTPDRPPGATRYWP